MWGGIEVKCEKCGRDMVIALVENGSYAKTEIWRCTNLRCGYMFRKVIMKNPSELR